MWGALIPHSTSASGPLAAPDVCDGTSAVGESRHRNFAFSHASMPIPSETRTPDRRQCGRTKQVRGDRVGAGVLERFNGPGKLACNVAAAARVLRLAFRQSQLIGQFHFTFPLGNGTFCRDLPPIRASAFGILRLAGSSSLLPGPLPRRFLA